MRCFALPPLAPGHASAVVGATKLPFGLRSASASAPATFLARFLGGGRGLDFQRQRPVALAVASRQARNRHGSLASRRECQRIQLVPGQLGLPTRRSADCGSSPCACELRAAGSYCRSGKQNPHPVGPAPLPQCIASPFAIGRGGAGFCSSWQYGKWQVASSSSSRSSHQPSAISQQQDTSQDRRQPPGARARSQVSSASSQQQQQQQQQQGSRGNGNGRQRGSGAGTAGAPGRNPPVPRACRRGGGTSPR
jgi:hypothetical protein